MNPYPPPNPSLSYPLPHRRLPLPSPSLLPPSPVFLPPPPSPPQEYRYPLPFPPLPPSFPPHPSSFLSPTPPPADIPLTHSPSPPPGDSDPSTEPSVGQYPTVVTQASGRRVLVVQAYAFGKYLGHLEVTFDAAGEVKSWRGNPVLMDNTVEEDPRILSELVPFQEQVESVVKEEIGKTYVFLDGTRVNCRMKECNLGNLQTDAIVHMNTKYPDDARWARTALAILNGGGIRASIDERASNGTITMEDILTVAPFQNTIDIVELKGRHVKEMFEYSVQNYDITGQNLFGGFLQVSGFVVVYDLNLPVGQRVVRLQARCVSCRVPEMKDVKEDEVYQVAMPSYLANGGDGYEVIRDNKVEHHLTGLLDTDAFSQYIMLNTPIYQGLENRILYINSNDLCPGSTAGRPQGFLGAVVLAIMVVVLAGRFEI
ncbi:hypothetical protein C7M84_021432 [Penaeus vannamei]|uniref:5'-nucleotidase n=1 Tax=Penaeus vannamei TaxID=6689 RepID=A0A423S9K8_PENVA|nr:hypothetical protein C7M84_021432 [Penaeus vannamei]